MDLLFALLLKKLGHEITVVYADESFPLQEIHRKEQPDKWAVKTRKNIAKFTQLAESAGIQVVPASTIKGPLDRKQRDIRRRFDRKHVVTEALSRWRNK